MIVLATLLGVIQLYLVTCALHLYFPMVGAVLGRFFPLDDDETPSAPPPRLAVLIAAHNEQAVIAGTLEALAASRYPTHGYDVFVVADNCRDQTAAIARRTGATVYERFSEAPSTKGQALAWMWGYVKHFGYGGVVVLDADNRADAGFLSAIATMLGRGYPAVQGLRRAQHADAPEGTAGLDALTELCTHRVGAAGRQWLGLNGPLMGSGVGYTAELFDRLISAVGETVVEDCEWQARLALDETTIVWTANAVIYDEKTARPDAMATQRSRWMAGRGQVARAFVGPLLKAFLSTGNLNALDMAVFLASPPRSLLLAGMGAFGLLALVAPAGSGVWPAAFWGAGLGLFAAYVLLGLWLDGAPAAAYRGLFRGVMQLPRFTWQMTQASWKAVTGAAVRWVPTPHGRA